MNGAASSPSSGCSAPARASSGPPWLWQPWPDPQPARCLQTGSPQSAAAWTCALLSGATAWPSAAVPSVPWYSVLVFSSPSVLCVQ